MSRESLCIRAAKICGQQTIELADHLGLRNKELLIQSDEKFLYIPIIHKPSQKAQNILVKKSSKFKLEVRFFEERASPKKTLVEVLENQFPPHLLASLPKALDIIGDIAIIEVPTETKAHEKALGEAVMQIHKNVRTVLAKSGAIIGTCRLREFDVIAGENNTTTVHKEFGCHYFMDVAKTYFSPRLSNEHKRVALLVQKGETVVDLFAGVGPFSVLIAKNTEKVLVYALDINPYAIEFLKKNIQLNRVQNCVIPILGDARKIVEDKLLGVADRVIMNLPESASEFVDVACKVLKSEGGVVHFYGFVRLPNSVDTLKNRLSEAVELAGRKVEGFLSVKKVRETAPFEWQVVLDARII